MRWADTDLLWGRPLRSILAVYNKKVLPFNYGHLKANEYTFIENASGNFSSGTLYLGFNISRSFTLKSEDEKSW